MPICEAAPGRFSTTTLWLSDLVSDSATMRAVRSVPPPGANGTMILIGWLGYAAGCDQAAAGAMHAPKTMASEARRCDIGSSVRLGRSRSGKRFPPLGARGLGTAPRRGDARLEGSACARMTPMLAARGAAVQSNIVRRTDTHRLSVPGGRSRRSGHAFTLQR